MLCKLLLKFQGVMSCAVLTVPTASCTAQQCSHGLATSSLVQPVTDLVFVILKFHMTGARATGFSVTFKLTGWCGSNRQGSLWMGQRVSAKSSFTTLHWRLLSFGQLALLPGTEITSMILTFKHNLTSHILLCLICQLLTSLTDKDALSVFFGFEMATCADRLENLGV